MIWKIDDLISEVSSYFTLKIGDILFTGTPEGVGQINIGDILEGYIEDKMVFSIKIK
jgi:2-keto-4-pentenoate hydratase/2-oxohepta-3-ene-1,7-dioic acid hydratase in catechol pathway